MDYSDKLINGGLHIKVNKKQKSINVPPRYMVNDIQLINDQFPPQPQRFSNNSIFSNIQRDKINNKNRYNYNNNMNNNNNFSQNGNEINYYTEGNNPLNSTNEGLKYQKINIVKRFNKNANKKYSSITNSKYKKKFVDNDNGNKLYIYKSETQYPFCSKKESVVEGESDNKSMKNISTGPGVKTMSLKHYKPHKKYNLENTGIRSKNYFINDFDNNIPLKSDYNKSTEKGNNYSELNFNKLKQNFYKSYKKDKNNISNYPNNINNTNTNDNLQNYSKVNNIIYNNKTEGYIKKTNNINTNNNYNNYENNNAKTESKDKKLLNIYKNKLINIFVRLMMNIFLKHKQKLFEDFLKGIKDTINNNMIYKTKKIDFQSNNPDDMEEEDDRINYYYIKKNKINVPENISNYNNNHKINLAKSISLNKNYSSMTMYKKAFKDNNSVLKNEKINRRIFINNKFRINMENDNNSIKRDSTKNIYIPAKSRYIGYNNNISRQKDNIFNELKINKSTRLFERNPNLYQNRNINTQINNFYNTNNSNFYISKINSFNSIMNPERQKSKDFMSKNSQKNNQNLSNKQNYYKENNNINVKCEIFKNRKRFPNVVYKKIFSTEKNSENNAESKNENENNNNVNIFMKRMERVYYKINKNNENNANQTYSIRRKYKNMNMNMNNDMNKNQFATIVNYTTESNDNNNYNYNNIDVSNDINNYNLEDIDKPTNMMYVKHDNDNKFYNDNEEKENNNDNNEDIDIKNLLQMKTNDKRLFLNFNYITINKYDNNKNKNYKFKKNKFKFKYKITNPYSIYIPSPSYTNDDNNNLSTISNINKSFKDSPEKINMNLNKYIKKRKIKSAILKLDNFMNDKIYGYKSIILKHLKSIKFKSIIYNIMQSHSLDILKKYFDIFKSNTTLLKEENNILFEETDDKINSKNINYIIDVNDFDDKSHQQSKERLKYLVKQINKNDDEENNEILNSSFDQGDIFENNGNINVKIPLWKSVQNININNNKKIYMKKSAKNKSNKSNGIGNDCGVNERKIEIFRNKIINFLFSKINK